MGGRIRIVSTPRWSGGVYAAGCWLVFGQGLARGVGALVLALGVSGAAT